MSFSVEAREVPGAGQGISLTNDFKLDAAAVTAAYWEEEERRQGQHRADALAHAEAVTAYQRPMLLLLLLRRERERVQPAPPSRSLSQKRRP